MRQPRGGGAPHAGPIIPTTTNLQFPHCAQEALAQVSKHVRLAGPSRKRSMAPQYADWQPLIDNDIFCLTNDRFTSRLTPLQQFALLRVLAQFFTEKSEDSSKNAYFEAIFLGRQGEPVLHDHRIEVLFDLASFALQYPVLHLFMPICQWLSKETTDKQYSEIFIKMLVEHFIHPEYEEKMYQYLFPLDLKCPEFTVFFLTYAPKYSDMSSPMVAVCGDYFIKNNNYILNQFRDSRPLAEEFAKNAFPKYLAYLISEQNIIPNTVNLKIGVLETLLKWQTKVKDVELDTSLLFQESTEWTGSRIDFLLGEMSRTTSRRNYVAEKISPISKAIPTRLVKAREFRDLISKVETKRKQESHKQKTKSEPMEVDDSSGSESVSGLPPRRAGLRGRKATESPKKPPPKPSPRVTRSNVESTRTKNPSISKDIPPPSSPEPEINSPESPQEEVPPPASPEPDIPPPQSPEPDIPPPASPTQTDISPLKQKVIPM